MPVKELPEGNQYKNNAIASIYAKLQAYADKKHSIVIGQENKEKLRVRKEIADAMIKMIEENKSANVLNSVLEAFRKKNEKYLKLEDPDSKETLKLPAILNELQTALQEIYGAAAAPKASRKLPDHPVGQPGAGGDPVPSSAVSSASSSAVVEPASTYGNIQIPDDAWKQPSPIASQGSEGYGNVPGRNAIKASAYPEAAGDDPSHPTYQFMTPNIVDSASPAAEKTDENTYGQVPGGDWANKPGATASSAPPTPYGAMPNLNKNPSTGSTPRSAGSTATPSSQPPASTTVYGAIPSAVGGRAANPSTLFAASGPKASAEDIKLATQVRDIAKYAGTQLQDDGWVKKFIHGKCTIADIKNNADEVLAQVQSLQLTGIAGPLKSKISAIEKDMTSTLKPAAPRQEGPSS